LCCLWYNIEKYGGSREATNDNTRRSMRVACWVSKATRAHAHVHAHAPGHPPTHTHIHAHEQTNARTRTH
jgi:hypothetical protein